MDKLLFLDTVLCSESEFTLKLNFIQKFLNLCNLSELDHLRMLKVRFLFMLFIVLQFTCQFISASSSQDWNLYKEELSKYIIFC